MTGSTLNCRRGDLAVVVYCDVRQNLGKIVHVEDPLGVVDWPTHGRTFVWRVSIVPEAPEGLIYAYPDGWVEEVTEGQVPDAFLRRIATVDAGNVAASRQAKAAEGEDAPVRVTEYSRREIGC